MCITSTDIVSIWFGLLGSHELGKPSFVVCVCVCVLGVFFPICGGLRDTSPAPLVQASLPLTTSKTCSPSQPCHQGSKQRYRIIDGLPSKETALLLSHFSGVQWCLFWFNVHSIPHRPVYSYDLEVKCMMFGLFFTVVCWPGEITIIAGVFLCGVVLCSNVAQMTAFPC